LNHGKPDLTLLEAQIAYCQQQGCDIIIASLHWGYEYEFFPRQHQVELAHALVEAGVDVVFNQWRGFAAPKGTPKMVIDKMSAIVKKAVESREWADFTASVGTTPQYQDPSDFAKFVAEMDRVTKEKAIEERNQIIQACLRRGSSSWDAVRM
jgi:hypothetical protein